MRFYTRRGDGGFTRLASGEQVRKSDPRIQSCGEIDELNSLLGWIHSQTDPRSKTAQALDGIQRDLFLLGAELSSSRTHPLKGRQGVTSRSVKKLEKLIEEWESPLPPVRGFIIPRGHPLAAAAHLARCVCRRAERTVSVLSTAKKVRPFSLSYLNRLSSWLFVFALSLNREHGVSETCWRPK
ncbi:MAG TPA: cob(I)yrinic acid a,c-diamide adenosyltransferase [Elusimicrobiota bacterium]|nr:cob(I)yrinic acid a,c-diamide adenosyltransferase [Elusimicrobiota bacterium]